ncbi:hypothetical protein J5N97_028760 [Dioscorea zingiberensis]|uniref:C2H2-type domain-containing protein n=1 Tax=Dioscorea zingiberensis TaxID=325984 RepID=A0A9D5C033_9LILI|nr:hypothetical protein J5N97_028760 [Dioscorea zingiberensis]
MDEEMMVNGGEEREGKVVMRQRRLFICKHCDRKFASSHAFCGHQNSHRKERVAVKVASSQHDGSPPLLPATVPAYDSPIMRSSSRQSSFHLWNRRFQPYHHPLQARPRFIIPRPPGHPVPGSGPFGGYGPPLRNADAAADSMRSKLAGGPVMRQALYDLRFEELDKLRELAGTEAEKKGKEQEEEEELDLTLHL